VDSYIQFFCLWTITRLFSHNGLEVTQLWEDVPVSSLRRLSGLDYRKSLAAEIIFGGIGIYRDSGASNRGTEETWFRSIDSSHFECFDLEAFLQVRS
jgi:hypothetical protein